VRPCIWLVDACRRDFLPFQSLILTLFTDLYYAKTDFQYLDESVAICEKTLVLIE